MIKTPEGLFDVTIDGIPGLNCCATSPDDALSMTARALEHLEREKAPVPDRGIYSWEEYVSNGLFPMGKMTFVDLPTGQRFLRKGFPTMWDKVSSTTACRLGGGADETEVPTEETVWHHVWALSDDLTSSERRERLLWSGRPDLHF